MWTVNPEKHTHGIKYHERVHAGSGNSLVPLRTCQPTYSTIKILLPEFLRACAHCYSEPVPIVSSWRTLALPQKQLRSSLMLSAEFKLKGSLI